MQRALIPFVLASLGFVIFVFAATSMPLFEWQINEFTEDFPPTHAVNSLSPPWVARLGDSFDDGRYIYSKVFISKDRKSCLQEDLKFVVRRSQNDEVLEQLSLNFSKSVPWLSVWGLAEIVLAGIYIWWFTISFEDRPISNAVTSTIIATVFGCCLLNVFIYVMKTAGGTSHYYFGTVECYHGTIAFNTSLSKIHYETLVVLFTGILLELGAMDTIVRQIMRAIIQRKESAKSAMG